MRTYARAQDKISKKQLSRVTSHDLHWENKMYKLERSIAFSWSQARDNAWKHVTIDWVCFRLFEKMARAFPVNRTAPCEVEQIQCRRE